LRKPKKLPGDVVGVDYGTEYSKDRLEIQKGRIGNQDKVLIVDDLLATGGTASAGCQLVNQCGSTIEECCFLIELDGLGGAKKLPKDVKYFALLKL